MVVRFKTSISQFIVLHSTTCSPNTSYPDHYLNRGYKYRVSNAALPYTEYPLQMLKFEIHTEITQYDANGRGGAYRKMLRTLTNAVTNNANDMQIPYK